MKTASEILHNLVKATNMSVKGFADGLEENYDRIFSIYCGRTKTISPDLVNKMTEKYGIEKHFLLTGDGEMFTAPEQNLGRDELVNGLFKVIESLRKENEELKAKLHDMEQKCTK